MLICCLCIWYQCGAHAVILSYKSVSGYAYLTLQISFMQKGFVQTRFLLNLSAQQDDLSITLTRHIS